ncbi:MAG: outer membrane protein assembly factor BamD [Gammaproteobacteria bacterium]|nr:outer membrane protein assembly factor BamD [Gammaproteobacteria bacterium]
MRPVLLVTVLLATALLQGCGLLPDKIDETADWSASKFYAEAKEALNDGDYTTAVEYYDSLMARFPFGHFAQQAQVDIAYAHYKDNEPDAALAALDRFIRNNPQHPHVDYAYYMKGVVNFSRDQSFFERWLPQDKSERDQGASKESFFDFQELVRRFPDSKYSADARSRMLFLRNNVAAYEIKAASYYMKRGAYVAAANRAEYVIENYQGTPIMPEAVAILFEAYDKLGLDGLAKDARRVLEQNYPDHPVVTGADKNSDCILWLFCV